MQVGDLVMDVVTGNIGIVIALINEIGYEPVVQVEFAKGRYLHSHAGLLLINK
jgi:hypothetical protein